MRKTLAFISILSCTALVSQAQIFKPQGSDITDSWNTYSTGIGTQQPYWNSKLDVAGDYAGHKFAAQLHLRTANNAYGMFLGSYTPSVGIISVGNHYAGGGEHIATAATGSGIIQYDGNIHFFTNTGLTESVNFIPGYKVTITSVGNVGIGTSIPDAKLTVKGIIHTEEVKVDLNVPGPDYVFEDDYKLPSLAEVASYVKQHKHLPEVPSSAEMEENGLNLKEMNLLLLKKVEELTLYVIDLKKENENLEKEIVVIKDLLKN